MKSRRIAACSMMFVALTGCGGYEGSEWDEGVTAEAELESEESLNSLETVNGITCANGLTSANGLADEIGLMGSLEGRRTVNYLVRCALPAGRSITKTYNSGQTQQFYGALGVAPEWENNACNTDCQERVTACLLAHLNTTGSQVEILLAGTNAEFPSIGPALVLGSYPRQESAFYGNLFISPPVMYQCDGANINPNPIAGRAGSSGTKQYGNRSTCSSDCTVSYGTHGDPAVPDGFSTCNGRGNVLTVYTRGQ